MPSGTRPPIPPLHAKLELQGTIWTHQYRLISYLALAGSGIGNADLNTLATTINTAYGTNVKPTVCASNVLTGVRIIYVPSVGAELQGINTTGQTGTHTGVNLDTASSCYVINWNVNRYYRGGHPRWYVPGVSADEIALGSSVSSTVRTALGTGFNAFLNAINAATTSNITSVQLGTLSFIQGGAWRVPPVFWPFATASASGLLGSQRRRIHS